MVRFTIYAGGYTSFIVSYLFDTQTASLTYLDTIATAANPSWLIQHPAVKNIVYAVNEVGPVGGLQAYAVTPSGGLSLLDEVSSGGDGPAFCAPLSTGQVAVMNYGSGDGRVIPTVRAGTQFDDATAPLLTFAPPTGGASHPHMAVEYGHEVFIPDLGADKIWRIGQTGAPGNFSIHGFIEQPTGSGPRHMAILDDSLYVIHELDNTLTKQSVPSFPNGTAPILISTSSLPSDRPANATFAAAELLLPPPSPLFPDPYIYVSNRNIGGTQDPRGDTIAIFEPAALRPVAQVYTGLVNIRGMALGAGEAGEGYLVALGAVSGGMVVYKRTEGGAALVEVARNASAVARTTVLMLEV